MGGKEAPGTLDEGIVTSTYRLTIYQILFNIINYT